ncbi:nucleotide exchange factor GrpE [Anaeroselena agilis]|uniref:Protein GrpE n=1 Tax=Anaeroselena agilis TaxID=3063788 RepID=A0ABU3P0B7_9FIRM|nr:nucleotide exchange factor GrpE [Selenomonadales bacterium 4137-cl]
MVNMEERKQTEQRKNAADAAGNAADGQVCFDCAEMKEIMESLDDKNRAMEELNNRLLRLQADFDNYRRRSRQEKEELSQVVAYGVLKELLPVLDNFERALAASTQDAAQLRAGVELVYRQLGGIIERLGVKPIAAVGNPFDPACHEAVMRVEDACQADGLIVEELQKGYEMGGKVLRPSMVKVVSNS